MERTARDATDNPVMDGRSAALPPSSEPTDPAAAYCATHPKVETYLRCGRCETPICPQCLYMTPVGARCRACARLKRLPMFDVRPLDYLRGLAAGIGSAAIGAILLQFVPSLGFFSVLLMLGLGYAVGEATTAAATRKRGTWLAIVGALAVPIGLIVGRALVLLLFAGGTGADIGSALLVGALSLAGSLWSILLVLAAMAIAASRIR